MRSPEGQKIAGVSGGAGDAGWGGGVTLTHTEKEQLLKVRKKIWKMSKYSFSLFLFSGEQC
jgi:hypothetical protein